GGRAADGGPVAAGSGRSACADGRDHGCRSHARHRAARRLSGRVPFFAYTGRNARGELVRGVLENSDSGAVADQLLTSGVSPIDISATSGPKALSGEGWLRRLSTDEVQLQG